MLALCIHCALAHDFKPVCVLLLLMQLCVASINMILHGSDAPFNIVEAGNLLEHSLEGYTRSVQHEIKTGMHQNKHSH